MNFKAFFAPEVGIRLTEDLNGFVCTVRRGLFRKESSEFVFNPNLDYLPEPLTTASGEVGLTVLSCHDRGKRTRGCDPLCIRTICGHCVGAGTRHRATSAGSVQDRPLREWRTLHIHVETPITAQHCVLLGSIAPPDEQLLSALLLAHTLKKEGARQVSAVFPYLGYARHDKDKPGSKHGDCVDRFAR
jgi:hypothetical protein